MPDGIWSMSDEGEFVLSEPYASKLLECKAAATQAWLNAAIGYLAQHSPYSPEELSTELARRNSIDHDKVALFDTFVLEALSGDL